MSSFWKDKNVIVTGGAGFLGKHLCKLLNSLDCNLYISRSGFYDLRYLWNCEQMLSDQDGDINGNIDILINLAANVGGIGYNQNHPYHLFYDNAIMGVHLIHTAIKHKVKKFIQIGTACSYPKFAIRTPFSEEMLWDGYPEETNAPYGLAKKMLLVQLQAARQEFGFNGIYLIPTNLYGPGDNFAEDRSHVIPAVIKKCIDGKRDSQDISVWGTGNASRDFLYVKDAAEAIILAAEHYDNDRPLNLGSGEEIRIASLVYIISQLTGFEGNVKWDTSKPDGQPSRSLNSINAAQDIGWKAETKFKDGLKETIKWYIDTLPKGNFYRNMSIAWL